MKIKKKSRFQNINLLIVPDDHSEPLSFRISRRLLILLGVLGVLLLAHIVTGGYIYWKYFRMVRAHEKLWAEKERLEEENLKIREIAGQFERLSRLSMKIKKTLGILKGSDFEEEGSQEQSLRAQQSPSVLRKSPIPSPEGKALASVSLNRVVDLIQPQESTLHQLCTSVPTLLPVSGYLTLRFNEYSNLETPSLRKRHPGIDIAARKGTLVRAAGSGYILFANWTPELGNVIIIYHGSGLFSLYAHTMRILRGRGYVRKGEPIALLGSSGLTSSGPHLHFEIWKDGVAVDPREFILALK